MPVDSKLQTLLNSHKRELEGFMNKLSDMADRQQEEIMRYFNEVAPPKNKGLKYWYTPLKNLPGYDGLPIRVTIFLKNEDIYYLGSLVTKNDLEELIKRSPNTAKKSFKDLREWLMGLGEVLYQDLKEYRENEALLRHFNEDITPHEVGFSLHRTLERSTYEKVKQANINTVGELATSNAIGGISDIGDLQAIESYLNEWDENLRLGMSPPYRPS